MIYNLKKNTFVFGDYCQRTIVNSVIAFMRMGNLPGV